MTCLEPCLENETKIRGHLKSSHIADKRKNFHMALYPLPPSSNESVIDNGRNVWQMGVHIILVLSHNLPKQCRLSHAGTPPWSFSVHCKMNKETISNSRRIVRFLLFFLFLHAQKRAAGVDLQSQTGASACHCLFSAFNLAFKSQSISVMDRLQPHLCTYHLFNLDLFKIAQ